MTSGTLTHALCINNNINYFQMAQNDQKTQHQQPQLCPKCKDMYAHPNFDNMCSLCYKKEKNLQANLETPKMTRHCHLEEEQAFPEYKIEPVSKAEEPKEEPNEQLPKGKCSKCSKRTGMLGFNCKHCSAQFCKMHRLPQEHSCCVNFIQLGRKRIKLDNPLIAAKKIEDI